VTPELSIVVPTLNRLDSLERALDSIRSSTAVAHEVIVYANRCAPETGTFLDGRPDVRSIRDPRNRYFTEAVNRAIAVARGRYVFLMNDDCEALRPDWFDFFRDLLELEPRIGAVGPHWRNIDELPLGWIEPYAALYRRDLFQELGPLPYVDSSFRLWWSDIYHAYKLMRNGYFILPLERDLAETFVKHARGAGEYGATVRAFMGRLPRGCFEFHGKELMYRRLGIADERELRGHYGGRIWGLQDALGVGNRAALATALL
jgi:GT2 family glycosyltransferase